MRFHVFLVTGLCIVFILSAGCLSNGIGEIIYEDSAFRISIDPAVLPDELLVQVFIFQIDGLHQRDEALIVERKSVGQDDSHLVIDAPLSEGHYKVHLTIFSNGRRLAGRIMDLSL